MIAKIKKENPYLKKKIMVFPPIDHSGLPAGKAAQITESLVDLLKESPRLLFYAPPQDLTLPTEVKTPKFGVAYYDPGLAKMARDKDMNALMAVHLPPIESTRGRAGIWPFRYDAEIYKISMIVNVMDVTNGCLYLTQFDSEEVPIALDEAKELNESDAFSQVVEEAMPAILKRQAAIVVKDLAEEVWTGRILDVSKGVLKINAGKDVGIFPDQLFTVYAPGESILCRTGRTVDLLGKNVGKIKAISVTEHCSLAAPESGGPFIAGQTVVFMPD